MKGDVAPDVYVLKLLKKKIDDGIVSENYQ